MLFDHVRRGARDPAKVQRLLAWLREVARPPPDVELHSADGSLFTGLVLVDRNRPVLMLAAQQRTAVRPSPSPPRYHGGLQGRLFDEEEEYRLRDEPYWRR